jgi:ribosomal protein L21E
MVSVPLRLREGSISTAIGFADAKKETATRYATKLVALFTVLAFGAAVMAADSTPAATDKPAEKHKVLHGVVKKIDGTSITVAVGKGEEAKEVVITTDDKTEFTVDHKAGKLEDVKVGELVAVGPAEGTAHHIDVNTTHKEGNRHDILHGIVKKVDGNAITVEMGAGDTAKEVVVQTDEKTKFTVDHADGKLADVKEGELVAIGPATGVAHRVDVNTTHKKGTD